MPATYDVKWSSFRRVPGDVLEIRLGIVVTNGSADPLIRLGGFTIAVVDPGNLIVDSSVDTPRDRARQPIQLPVVVVAGQESELVTVMRSLTLRNFGNNIPFRAGSLLQIQEQASNRQIDVPFPQRLQPLEA